MWKANKGLRQNKKHLNSSFGLAFLGLQKIVGVKNMKVYDISCEMTNKIRVPVLDQAQTSINYVTRIKNILNFVLLTPSKKPKMRIPVSEFLWEQKKLQLLLSREN